MKRLIMMSSFLAVFFIGCGDGGTQTCKDLETLLKCGFEVKSDNALVKKCSALPEAEQAKLYSCFKAEENNWCAALTKVSQGDQGSRQAIENIAQKCDAESKK
jgi:hypothetical protein